MHGDIRTFRQGACNALRCLLYRGRASSSVEMRSMRLPNEPLMSRHHYKRLVNERIAREQKNLEWWLNSTIQQKFLALGAVLAGVASGYILYSLEGLIYAALATLVVGFVVFSVGLLIVPGRTPEQGRWIVTVEPHNYRPGTIVNFRCERVVDGSVVEEQIL